MRVEIDYAEATFDLQGSSYEATGGVVHNTTTKDIGIGSYEYWGHREYNSKIVEVSEYKEAEFLDVNIYNLKSTSLFEPALNNPPPALLEAAQSALYSKTYEQAEEQATEEAK